MKKTEYIELKYFCLNFLNPNAGFSLMGHFIGLFFKYCFTQVVGSFLFIFSCWVILMPFFFSNQPLS